MNKIDPEKIIKYIRSKSKQKYGILCINSLFTNCKIDDIVCFLRPAQKMGFKTIHYSSNCDLRERLKQLGIKI